MTVKQPSTVIDRYAQRFENLKAKNQHGFIPFTLLGWPDENTSFDIIKTMIDSGVTALELGLAFSDPAADGPVIQQAAQEVIQSGFSVDDAICLLKRVREYDSAIPIGLLVYYNMVLARGASQFFKELADVGVDGVLIADLSPESADELLPIGRQYGVHLIFVISPLTSDQRLKKIATMAGGFLYVVSRLGITGTEERYDADLENLLERIKSVSSLPLCVGFGISKPEHIQKMVSLGADGCIVGSAILKLVNREGINYRSFLSRYLKDLKASL